MNIVLLGKKCENRYNINDKKTEVADRDGSVKTIFTAKPELQRVVDIVEYPEILRFEGELRYNSRRDYLFTPNYFNMINISEDEAVRIEKEVFRADLNELHVFIDKTISETDIDKEAAEAEFDKVIREFNKTMIESNNALKNYCDLHKLNYEETDCIAVFNVVFPSSVYTITDGKLVAMENARIYVSSAVSITGDNL